MTAHHTYRCTAATTRAENGRRVQCTRRMTGHGENAEHAEQAARDKAVLTDWAVNGDDWSLAELRGLRCPRHA